MMLIIYLLAIVILGIFVQEVIVTFELDKPVPPQPTFDDIMVDLECMSCPDSLRECTL